ncbi:MAG: family 16 glycoside hydrolase [Verrucomicrobiota bacterium]
MRFLHLKLLCPLMVVIGLAAGSGIAATANFDHAKPGEFPAGWMAWLAGAGESKWSVQQDDTAPSRPNVLKQSGWTPKPSFPLCVNTNATLQDGFVEVKFKPVSGTNDQAAGLVWRCQDAENYYVARANALEDNVVLYKVAQGRRKALDIVGRTGGYGVNAKVPAQTWSTLRVHFAGNRFTVLLNGKELFAVEDATFPNVGLVGLWTKADSVVLFDDFQYGEAPR